MSTNETAREDSALSRDAEERLVELGRRVFGSAFPDPDRAAAIDSATLRAAARRSRREPLPADVVDALTWSSETFAEYEQYLREARFARTMWRLAACAAVTVGLGAALWWSVGSRAPLPDENPIVEEMPAPKSAPTPGVVPEQTRPQPAATPPVEVASLDLRGRSPVRGETAPEAGDLPVVPAGRVELTVILPIGSEEGEYEVAVLRSAGEPPLVSGRSQAELKRQNVVLQAGLDLSNVEPGRYYCGLRRGEFRWSYYGIEVR